MSFINSCIIDSGAEWRVRALVFFDNWEEGEKERGLIDGNNRFSCRKGGSVSSVNVISVWRAKVNWFG